MATKKEFVTVHAGLERANINHDNQIQLPQKPAQSSDDHGDDDADEKHRSLRVAISEKRHGAAVKIRKTLHISKGTDVEDDLGHQDSLLANPVTEKSDSRLKEKMPVPDKGTMKDFMHDPVDTVKSKISGQGNHEVAANMAAKEISHGQEVDLLKAHDDVQSAETQEKKERATETFEELLKERQNMYVRWTLDRHITKVRILPRDRFLLKSKSDFQTKDASGNLVTGWRAYGQHLTEYAAQQYGGQYIGYGMDHPAPTKESIMPNVERLIIASSPFQEFIMTTRRVYRWEDRMETTKYLLVYIGLWATNLLLPGILSAIVYLVIERRVNSPTMKDIRQDIERTEDRKQTALTLTEYIQKEGDGQWADKILEDLGPWLMVQLADLANFFETLRNFYEWRVPSRTMGTIAIFIIGILAISFIPAWLFVKISTLGMGITFFGLFPFAVNFPEYRLLASFPKRIFWGIPTHAEWSMKVIQAEGSRYQETNGTVPFTLPSASNDCPQTASKTHDYGVYTAHHENKRGRLVISNSSVRFTSHQHYSPTKEEVLWMLPYSQIERIEKIQRVVGESLPKPKSDNGKDLKLQSKTGQEWVLTNLDLRDQVFSQVVGFSDSAWQIVW